MFNSQKIKHIFLSDDDRVNALFDYVMKIVEGPMVANGVYT